MTGAALWLNDLSGRAVARAASASPFVIVMLFGWFGTVIGESEGGLYNTQGRLVVPLGHEPGSSSPR